MKKKSITKVFIFSQKHFIKKSIFHIYSLKRNNSSTLYKKSKTFFYIYLKQKFLKHFYIYLNQKLLKTSFVYLFEKSLAYSSILFCILK